MMASRVKVTADQERWRNALIALGALTWAAAWLMLGLPAVLAGVAVWVGLWLLRADLLICCLTAATCAAALAGFTMANGWDPAWMVSTPWSMGRAIFDGAVPLDRWLWPFDFPGQLPAWHILVGATHGSLAAMIWSVVRTLSAQGPRGAKRKRAARGSRPDTPAPVRPGRLRAATMERRARASTGGTVLGVARTGRIAEISDAAANTHTLVVGTTGGGKTVTVLNFVESFIRRGLPVLYVDGKGDRPLGARIVAFAEQAGRGGRLFSMAGDSAAYNPLASGSFTSQKDRLIELREWTEPHYRKLAEGYLQMVFKVLSACGQQPGLLELAGGWRRSQLGDAARQATTAGRLDDSQATALLAEIEEQERAEKQVEGVAAEIRNLARSELGHLFRRDGFALGDDLAAGRTVYMGLNPLSFPALARVMGKLIVNDFKATLDPACPRATLVVFDEFGVFAGDQVLNVINQGRSAGVCAVLTVQSVSDIGREIERNADHFIEQIFSNCNTYLVHRVNSAANAEQLAAVIGTRSSAQLTAQLDDFGPTGMGSLRDTREFIVHPDVIKTLPTGSAVFLSRNSGEVLEIKVRKGQLA